MLRRYLHASLVLLLLACLFVPADSFAKGGRGFSGARSFSGGSRTGGFGGGFGSGFGSGRSFSTPKSTPSPTRGISRSGGFTTRYDNNAASARRAQSSRSLYEQANGLFGGGRTANAERVGPVTQETIETRPSRFREIFSTYTSRPVTIYHDSFNPWFWMWLMDRGQRDRDLWVYNHRDEMDEERYRDLKSKDADLENRLNALENQGVPRDSSYTPAGVDRDLMYDDNQVQDAYAETRSHALWGWLVIGLVGVGLAYLIFFVPMFNARRPAYKWNSGN
jgi:hypothetical protein